jgi:hypothetical protein
MSYPVTHLMLSAEEAGELRRLHASGEEAAVLSRVRELGTSPAEILSIDRTWEPMRRCLVGYYAFRGGQSVFGRRDYVINLLDTDEAATAAAALGDVSQSWLRERFEKIELPLELDPDQPRHSSDFGEIWESFARLAEFFGRASRASRARRFVVFFTASRYWRPPRLETGPDGGTRVVRPAYRPEDYAVEPGSIRSLPTDGGSWPFEAELTDRDGTLYSWTEVERFTRGGRTWVRMTISNSEYYIDVENADGRIGRIECVDPLVAYWLARRTDKYPVVLEG